MNTVPIFNQIAPKYDFLNHFLSLGIDKRWRKKCVKIARKYHPNIILDIAAGTGDLTLEFCRLKPKTLIALDPAQNMLEIASKKFSRKNCSAQTLLASAENIPFPDESFDLISCAFGVRNFDDFNKSMVEIRRVLKKNGIFLVIEFGFPRLKWLKILYSFYFFKLLPFLANLFTRHKHAYEYLNSSVSSFPYDKAFAEKIKLLGFETLQIYPLTWGIAYLYELRKTIDS
jgi:demethylmenaquinone methyltransferase/2-methoxy-6-polyprenyl-1,4-benzoquinol methylase